MTPCTLADFMDDGGVIKIGAIISIVAILCGTIKSVVKTRSRETTRREIAAYIAEGSMSPEQGEKLMGAGEKPEKT